MVSVSVSTLLQRMHAVLGPKGFTRKGYSWYRTVTPFTQVINIQIASYRTHATVNLGVHERRIFQQATGNEGRSFVDEAECIVRSRIGFLVGNVDKWWEISDPLEVDEMVEIVQDKATNFFDRHQSLEDVAASLEKSKVVDGPYPLPAIYLALIVRELGQTTRGNDILRQLEAKTLGGWRSRITELLTAE